MNKASTNIQSGSLIRNRMSGRFKEADVLPFTGSLSTIDLTILLRSCFIIPNFPSPQVDQQHIMQKNNIP